jgi:hypothetical protein
VPWSHSKDGALRFNDNIMIASKHVGGAMVADIGKRIECLDEAYPVTSSASNPGPINRTIFKLVKADPNDDQFGSDSLIRYGQKVRIETNDYLFKKTLCLSSQPLGPTCYSPVSRAQECTLSPKKNFNAVWVFDSLDPNNRFEMQGQPVMTGEGLLIRHCQTNNFLSSDKACIQANDYGREYEVCVSSQSTKNRSQNLALEKGGKITGDVATKF